MSIYRSGLDSPTKYYLSSPPSSDDEGLNFSDEEFVRSLKRIGTGSPIDGLVLQEFEIAERNVTKLDKKMDGICSKIGELFCSFQGHQKETERTRRFYEQSIQREIEHNKELKNELKSNQENFYNERKRNEELSRELKESEESIILLRKKLDEFRGTARCSYTSIATALCVSTSIGILAGMSLTPSSTASNSKTNDSSYLGSIGATVSHSVNWISNLLIETAKGVVAATTLIFGVWASANILRLLNTFRIEAQEEDQNVSPRSASPAFVFGQSGEPSSEGERSSRSSSPVNAEPSPAQSAERQERRRVDWSRIKERDEEIKSRLKQMKESSDRFKQKVRNNKIKMGLT